MKKVAFLLVLTFLISIYLSVNTSAAKDPQTGFYGMANYYELIPGLREVSFELHGATVVIKNESGDTVKTTTTDSGFYSTGYLPNGKYTITVSVKGTYTNYNYSLTKKRIIEDGQSAEVDFILTSEDTRNNAKEYSAGLIPTDFIDDTEYYQVWNKDLINVDETKEWTINFNQPVNPDSINQDTIYITGKWWQKKPKLTFEFLNNNEVVKVKSDYSDLGANYSGLYHLYITKDIQSVSGKPLKNSIIMDFNLNAQWEDIPGEWSDPFSFRLITAIHYDLVSTYKEINFTYDD